MAVATNSQDDTLSRLADLLATMPSASGHRTAPLSSRGFNLHWPSYQHDHSEKFMDFLRKFELNAKLDMYSDDQKCLVMEACLAGPALAIFRDSLPGEAKENWSTLKNALTIAFNPPENVCACRITIPALDATLQH